MKKILVVFIISLSINGFAQSDPLQTKDSIAQLRWVDSIMKGMTINQKVGQLLMVAAYSNKDINHENEIRHLIEKHHIGSLIFFQNQPVKQALLTNDYQSLSKIPLLIGLDGEWGLDMRLKNTVGFPYNMALGAIRNDELIEDIGVQIGKHFKRMGIHIDFAPVVDVNTNPKNPVIGNRSYGEDEINVANKAAAFTKGIQSQNVMACAKHFPGHGDTAQDSHHTLPTVDLSMERLDSIELFPYKRMFKEGLGSIMVLT